MTNEEREMFKEKYEALYYELEMLSVVEKSIVEEQEQIMTQPISRKKYDTNKKELKRIHTRQNRLKEHLRYLLIKEIGAIGD